MDHKFPYEWYIKDGYPAKGIDYHGLKVFSCFACGGGSSMGYKLSGYDVIGCNEIDKRMMEVYIENHKPKYSFLEPIQTFKDREDLPKELYSLDTLDGSPPCSSFSSFGNREKDWGKEKKLREGQQEQVLDTLFYDFIDLAKRLQSKVVIAENVKGLLQGNAKQYVIEIYRQLEEAGYYVQYWLLDASKMGVPQRRERVFFIGLRKDMAGPFLKQKDLFTIVPELDLMFNEKGIPFGEIQQYGVERETVRPGYIKHWEGANEVGRSCVTETGNTFGFFNRAKKNLVLKTIATKKGGIAIDDNPLLLTDKEIIDCGSFPTDYNFLETKVQYIVGMSVPPIVMAQISSNIYDQWLSKI